MISAKEESVDSPVAEDPELIDEEAEYVSDPVQLASSVGAAEAPSSLC